MYSLKSILVFKWTRSFADYLLLPYVKGVKKVRSLINLFPIKFVIMHLITEIALIFFIVDILENK